MTDFEQRLVQGGYDICAIPVEVVRLALMNRPACVIRFAQGQQQVVAGELSEIRAALESGGMVELVDPWDRPVAVNAANVTTIEPLPGGDEGGS